MVEIKDANHLTCVGKPQFKEEIQKWLAKQARRRANSLSTKMDRDRNVTNGSVTEMGQNSRPATTRAEILNTILNL